MKLRNGGNPFTLYHVHGIGLFETEADAQLGGKDKGEWGGNLNIYPQSYIQAPDGNIYQISAKLSATIIPSGFAAKVAAAKSKLSAEELTALEFTLKGS